MGEHLKKGMTALALAVVAILLGVVGGQARRLPVSTVTPSSRSSTTSGAAEATIAVHVSGWVVSPGVVELGEGALVADAVAAAGGIRPGALVGGINLAAEVAAGEQVLVPGPQEVDIGQEAKADGTLRLNSATSTELQSLPGVGPVLAERIVAFRDEHGPFGAVEDLLEVPGIGEAKLEAIREIVRP